MSQTDIPFQNKQEIRTLNKAQKVVLQNWLINITLMATNYTLAFTCKWTLNFNRHIGIYSYHPINPTHRFNDRIRIHPYQTTNYVNAAYPSLQCQRWDVYGLQKLLCFSNTNTHPHYIKFIWKASVRALNPNIVRNHKTISL